MLLSFPRCLRALFPVAVVVAFASVGQAQTFVDGVVLDPFGAPVAGVDIDIDNVGGGGGTPAVSQDFTDAFGVFHMQILTTASSIYDITLVPPQPPASTALITVVESVSIPGSLTTNLGTIQLAGGYSIVGRVVNSGGGAVPNLNFDVIDAGGNNVDLAFDRSDVNGDFAFSAPGGPILLRFVTPSVAGQTLAPLEMPLSLGSNVNLGTVVLQPGFTVSALVRTPSGVGIANADVDVIDVATGVQLYTPNDDTSATGLVTVVVPAGTFDFEFYPPPATTNAPVRLPARVIAANTSLGIVTCPLGVVLSGTVRNSANAPVAGVDVDVRDSATNVDLLLQGDLSDASGFYSVVVPPGTYDVEFEPAGTMPYSKDIVYGNPVVANTTVDGTLRPPFVPSCFGDGTTATPCPCANFGAAGRGCANSANASGAVLAATGAIVIDPDTGTDTLVLAVSGGPNIASVAAIFLQGTAYSPAGTVFGDGVLCLGGALVRLGSKPMPGGLAAFPEPGNLSVSQRGGVVPGSGAMRWYATYYRNSAAAFCPPSTFNVTNTLQVTW